MVLQMKEAVTIIVFPYSYNEYTPEETEEVWK